MNALVGSSETHSSRESFGCSTFADERDGTERGEEVGVLDTIDKVDMSEETCSIRESAWN